MKTLIIRSSEWLRGGGRLFSRLHHKGQFCCLGLHARDCGISPEQMGYRNGPATLMGDLVSEKSDADFTYHEFFKCWVDVVNGEYYITTDANEALWINDAILDSTDEDKIEHLRTIFLSKGIEIDWRPNE